MDDGKVVYLSMHPARSLPPDGSISFTVKPLSGKPLECVMQNTNHWSDLAQIVETAMGIPTDAILFLVGGEVRWGAQGDDLPDLMLKEVRQNSTSLALLHANVSIVRRHQRLNREHGSDVARFLKCTTDRLRWWSADVVQDVQCFVMNGVLWTIIPA